MTHIPADKKIGHAANTNTKVSLGRTFNHFDGAMVTPVSTVAYFVANASNGVAGNKALYRQEDNQNAEEIADGVEQMQIEYLSSATLGTALPTRNYVSADKVAAGAAVIAVRVHLLLKSQEAGVSSGKQELLFAGTTFKATDNRLYTPFSTTITLRNQGLN